MIYTHPSPDPSKTFIICAPPYKGSSAGIVVLHELCDAIVSLGYCAHVILLDTSTPDLSFVLSNEPIHFETNLKYAYVPPDESGSEWIREVLEKGIVIYPEIVIGNPLNAKHVVRYFLNKDGAISGKKSEYQKSDFCLAFSKVFFENPQAILFRPIKSKFFNTVDALPFENRTIDLTYFGKGVKYASCFRVKGSIQLDREWPKTKEELAVLLKNTRYLFSWDNVTSLNSDAFYCGAKVVLLQFAQADETTLANGEAGPEPYLKGLMNGEDVTVVDNPNYDHLRTQFIENMNVFEKDWLKNVQATIDSIFRFFQLNR
jgi:hypothetical protein